MLPNGSRPSYRVLTRILNRYNRISKGVKHNYLILVAQFVSGSSWLPVYYKVTDLIWQDGLLIDFLQKKVADKWIRRFLVTSSYLFSERVLFKFTTRFYIDSVIWPMTLSSVFEYSSVASTLSALLISVALVALLFNLNYLFLTLL